MPTRNGGSRLSSSKFSSSLQLHSKKSLNPINSVNIITKNNNNNHGYHNSDNNDNSNGSNGSVVFLSSSPHENPNNLLPLSLVRGRFQATEEAVVIRCVLFLARHVRADGEILDKCSKNPTTKLFFEPQYEAKVKETLQVPPRNVHEISDFILNLLHDGRFGSSSLILATILLSRFKAASSVTIHTSTFRPLFATALLLADKFYEDKPLKNAYMKSLLPSVPLANVHLMEMSMLLMLGFDVVVRAELFLGFCEKLLEEQLPSGELLEKLENSPFVAEIRQNQINQNINRKTVLPLDFQKILNFGYVEPSSFGISSTLLTQQQQKQQQQQQQQQKTHFSKEASPTLKSPPPQPHPPKKVISSSNASALLSKSNLQKLTTTTSSSATTLTTTTSAAGQSQRKTSQTSSPMFVSPFESARRISDRKSSTATILPTTTTKTTTTATLPKPLLQQQQPKFGKALPFPSVAAKSSTSTTTSTTTNPYGAGFSYVQPVSKTTHIRAFSEGTGMRRVFNYSINNNNNNNINFRYINHNNNNVAVPNQSFSMLSSRIMNNPIATFSENFAQANNSFGRRTTFPSLQQQQQQQQPGRILPLFNFHSLKQQPAMPLKFNMLAEVSSQIRAFSGSRGPTPPLGNGNFVSKHNNINYNNDIDNNNNNNTVKSLSKSSLLLPSVKIAKSSSSNQQHPQSFPFYHSGAVGVSAGF